MNLEDERKLKFDRRLRTRQGWVTDEEIKTEEASLVDTAEKVAVEAEPPAPDAPAS